MKVIGLTGGIASGKSTISNILREYNIPIIDADYIAREVVTTGTTAFNKIVKEFGAELINAEGDLNRKMLGKIVFNDRNKLELLNSITHPEIKKCIISEINKYSIMGKGLCVIDAALLIEGKFLNLVNYIILVYTDPDIVINRLKLRDAISEGEALSRIQTQMPFEEKKKYADFIINNSRDIEYTRNQLSIILKKLYIMEDRNV